MRRLRRPLKASELCRGLELRLLGADREIRELCGLDSLAEGGLSFLRDRTAREGCSGTVFAPGPIDGASLSVILSDKPRLAFISAQHRLQGSPGFVEEWTAPDIHPTAVIGRRAVIEDGVKIGARTRIGSLAVIKAGTSIGSDCEIKSGAVIGDSGFGFERDSRNRPLKMLHWGGVRIGDHVEIGSLTTVCRGALSDTIIEDFVKIDDHVHISHNCVIGEGAIITACVSMSGSVRVGKNVWLAPNSSLIQKISVGDGAFIGIGSVVTRKVPPECRLFGNPARPI